MIGAGSLVLEPGAQAWMSSSHGTAAQRIASFDAGVHAGVAGCC